MSLLCRGARVAARCSKRTSTRQPRRFDTHDASHGNSESAFHVPGGRGNESLGPSFYIGVSLIPLSIVAYTIAASSEEPILSRLINAYSYREKDLERMNEVTEVAIGQAAADRVLFANMPMEQSGPELKYPEQFNTGSPWNVVAGQGTADLRTLSEHIAQREQQLEDDRVANMKDGNVVTVYDDTTGGRFPAWFPFVGKKEGK